MKRLFCIFLAIAMALSLISTAFAADVMADTEVLKYVFSAKTLDTAGSSHISDTNYNKGEDGKVQLGAYYNVTNETTGDKSYEITGSDRWALIGKRSFSSFNFRTEGYFYGTIASTNSTETQIEALDPGFIVKIEVPESGVYKPVLAHWTVSTGAKYELYAVDTDYGDVDQTFAEETLILPNSNSTTNEYKIQNAIDKCKAGSAGVSLGVIDTYSATTVKTATEDFGGISIYLEKGEYYLVFAYRGPGSGTVATAAPGFYALSLTLTPQTVKLYAYPYDNNGTVSRTGVNDVRTGVETTVTATPNEGYEFSHWQNVSGDVLSELASYTFTPYSNTVLIAMFKEVNATEKIGVDFYDANRDYLGFREVASGSTFGTITDIPTPGMVGYEFTGKWGIDKKNEIGAETVIDKRISVVALYEENGVDVNATVKVNNVEVGESAYGEAITEMVPGATRWYRDEQPVDYGETYTYYIWDSTSIASSDEEVTEKAPLILMDDPAYGAYMIEYDEGDCKAVEAGIIFGGEDVSLDSCYTKAKVREIKDHGQFTAKPEGKTPENETYARGYLIYNDNGIVKTKYSSVISISE